MNINTGQLASLAILGVVLPVEIMLFPLGFAVAYSMNFKHAEAT